MEGTPHPTAAENSLAEEAQPIDREGSLTAGDKPPIEIGCIIAGRLEDCDRQAVERARESVLEWLSKTFPDFAWQMPIFERDEIVQDPRVDAVRLLDYGLVERNTRNWDFMLVITPADLVSYYRKDALSVVSRALQSAVISTARIDPRAYDKSIPDERRTQRMARRLETLVIHLVGHLGGLGDVRDPENFMAHFETISELDEPTQLSNHQQEELQEVLVEIADRRLEEETDVERVRALRFYLEAAWINRIQIGKAILRARPWQFPFRLSRLTTAAVSAAAVLTMTAEVWELGLRQTGLWLTTLSFAAIVLTTFYITTRQRIFVRRERARLSELTVLTNLSTIAILLCGMVTTYALLYLATFLFGSMFFSAPIVESWAPSSADLSQPAAFAKLAAFVASIGLFIGALGATFENNHYFRHVIFVDEEI